MISLPLKGDTPLVAFIMATATLEKHSETQTALPPSFSHTPSFMTFEQFLSWASEDTHAEWVDGRIIFLSASNQHQLIVSFLLSLFRLWIDTQEVGG